VNTEYVVLEAFVGAEQEMAIRALLQLGKLFALMATTTVYFPVHYLLLRDFDATATADRESKR
jgi:hypothetical protein